MRSSRTLIEVVGAASNGAIGLQRIPQLNPDVITLDIEMPDMDGLEMLRRIRRRVSQVRVIMFSTLTERGAAKTLEALTLGADDYVAKVSNEGSLDLSMARLREEMIPKIMQFFRLPAQAALRSRLRQRATSPPVRRVPQAAARHEGAAEGPGHRCLHGRPDSARRYSATVAGRLSFAGSGGAAHAATLYALAGGAPQFHLQAAGRRGLPGQDR